MKRIALFFSLFLMLNYSTLKAQTTDNTKFEYGIIHYEIRETRLTTYFNGENNVENLSGGKDYNIRMLELLNSYGSQGWEICSSDAYQSLKFASNPNTAILVYLKRKK